MYFSYILLSAVRNKEINVNDISFQFRFVFRVGKTRRIRNRFLFAFDKSN